MELILLQGFVCLVLLQFQIVIYVHLTQVTVFNVCPLLAPVREHVSLVRMTNVLIVLLILQYAEHVASIMVLMLQDHVYFV